MLNYLKKLYGLYYITVPKQELYILNNKKLISLKKSFEILSNCVDGMNLLELCNYFNGVPHIKIILNFANIK
jgi:hypothetical protein